MLVLIVLLINVVAAFDYGYETPNNQTNVTVALETNTTISLTSDYANIKNQFDAGNYTEKSDFGTFSTDLTDCGKAVIKKYNLSVETGLAFYSISSPQFLDIMNNGTDLEAKIALINAFDPFFEKLSGFDHDSIIKSMPEEVINWVKSTAFLMKTIQDNIAKEYEEDRLNAQTNPQN